MKLALCWIVMITGIAQFCHASDSRSSRKTLAGITAVQVMVQHLPPGATKVGITENSIQTDVELKLRLAGMRVVESSSTRLYVEVNLTDSGSAASVDVELHQAVTLARDPSIVVLATTWSNGSVGSNTSEVRIRNAVKDIVDRFLNAWLSANPSRSPSSN